MRLGKYQLVRQLAVGGMAEVYLAKATTADGMRRLVVLKRILPQYATDAYFVDMFLNEARITSSLDHRNIAKVYDIGAFVGNHYFTMEYIAGQDLRAILKAEHRDGRAIPLPIAIEIARGVAAGLHCAHEQRGPLDEPLGIVHRDVSLSNVLVAYDGSVKLVDFGVAKCETNRQHTRAGTLKGKIAYMSPEQCRGEPIDRRSDIFSLGIVLYEMTTGTRLFGGGNDLATLQKIACTDAPPPSACVPDYPAGLERIVLKALQRPRDRRYATAREVQTDLEEFAATHHMAAPTLAISAYMHRLFNDAIAGQESTDTISRKLRAIDVAGTSVSHARMEADTVLMPVPKTAPAQQPAVSRWRQPTLAMWIAIWIAAAIVSFLAGLLFLEHS